MITQSFLYNAIFFTYALVLTKIYNVPATDTAYYFIFFALGNLIGPLTIGHLFDTIGRRKMISFTYIFAGALLATSAVLFNAGALSAVTQTACWCVIFFFASAGASSAYLTVSEIFPVEVRAKAIAVFLPLPRASGRSAPGSMENSSEVVRITSSCSLAISLGPVSWPSAGSLKSSSGSTPSSSHSKIWLSRCQLRVLRLTLGGDRRSSVTGSAEHADVRPPSGAKNLDKPTSVRKVSD